MYASETGDNTVKQKEQGRKDQSYSGFNPSAHNLPLT